jgi:threonylcarbamoyladenosine tRNA methylthiotransferase MtaB
MPKILRIAIETLGCKLNQAESEEIARQLSLAGCEIVSLENGADIFILNTCTVTHVADRKCRNLLRQVAASNPDIKVVALGCYADSSAEELAKLPGISAVLGNVAKEDLIDRLRQYPWFSSGQQTRSPVAVRRTRSFIKAQDGCTNFCTYCIVPSVRGSEKSLPVSQIIHLINDKVNQGFREVVLTGTEIGRFSDAGKNLKDLIQSILNETKIERLRLSSLQPQEIVPELISAWQNPRLCRHFHIALQSGSDSVLARMKRRYNTSMYREKIEYLRQCIPQVAVTTDVIAGFPGETDAEHLESLQFCRQMGFSRMHVFPYSARRGTPAAVFSGQVAAEIKKDRCNQLLVLGKETLSAYNSRFLGKTQNVLVEQNSRGICSGYTDTYIKVYIKNSDDLTNCIFPVRLLELKADGMKGEVFKPE